MPNLDFGTPSTSRYRAIVDEEVQSEPRRRSTTKTPTGTSVHDETKINVPIRVLSEVAGDRQSLSSCRTGSSSTVVSPRTGIRSSDSSIARYVQRSRQRLQGLFRSFSSSSSPICRICHEGDQKETLVSPCYCSGTMGLVHVTCMERWLSSTSSDVCELCHYKFKTKKTPKSLSDWLKDSGGRGRHQRSLVGDGVCFALLTPLAFVGGFLCIEGAHQQAIEGNRMEAGCLVALSSVLAVVYFLWTGLTCRYYYRHWKQWQLTNHNIHVIVTEKNVKREPASSPNVGRSSQEQPVSSTPPVEEVIIEPRPPLSSEDSEQAESASSFAEEREAPSIPNEGRWQIQYPTESTV